MPIDAVAPDRSSVEPTGERLNLPREVPADQRQDRLVAALSLGPAQRERDGVDQRLGLVVLAVPGVRDVMGVERPQPDAFTVLALVMGEVGADPLGATRPG